MTFDPREALCNDCGTYVLERDRYRSCAYCAWTLCASCDEWHRDQHGRCHTCQTRHADLAARGILLPGMSERSKALTAGMIARIKQAQVQRGTRQPPTEEERRRDEQRIEAAHLLTHPNR